MLSYVKTRLAGSILFIVFVAAQLPFCVYGQNEIKTLSLSEAIEIGLKNNPEIRSARENISASKGKFWSGISLPQPEVGISYEYTPVNKSLSNYGEKTISFSQSFEFPSNYFLKGNKLSKEESAAACKLQLTERSVIYKVKTGYYKALAKQAQVKLAEENLKISEDFYKKAGIRENVGEGTNLEKLTAKVQYTEAINNLEIAKNELKSAEAELNYSLGYGKQSYNSKIKLADSLAFTDNKIDYEKIYKSVAETNPQIKIAELNYGISSVEKGIAWSSLLPNFNLAYFKQSREGDAGYYGASFGISVPLWFMFDQRGKIEEASANQSMLEAELQSTQNEIDLKLNNAITDHENNLKQVKFYLEEILPQAQEIYRSAVKSYDAGELTYLEYLQARQTLINSRKNYINVLLSYYQSVFSIEEIAGTNSIEKLELEK